MADLKPIKEAYKKHNEKENEAYKKKVKAGRKKKRNSNEYALFVQKRYPILQKEKLDELGNEANLEAEHRRQIIKQIGQEWREWREFQLPILSPEETDQLQNILGIPTTPRSDSPDLVSSLPLT